jgi:hypothetical protein
MPKKPAHKTATRSSQPPAAVREPVQVYLAPDDSAILARLADSTGLSKAEVLRRGIRSLAREQGASAPMLGFLRETADAGWPASGIAGDHDAVLAESYRGRKRKPR